jgi:hypothetical protein
MCAYHIEIVEKAIAFQEMEAHLEKKTVLKATTYELVTREFIVSQQPDSSILAFAVQYL